MKQLVAQRVSDGWIITIRQVFHVKDKKEVDTFIHYHGMDKDEKESGEDRIVAEST